MPTPSSEGILDASISFGRRTTTRLPQESTSSNEYDSEQYDFLALMTAIAELYSQEDILEMQCRKDTGKPLARGAVSEVSTIFAAVARPSAVVSHQIRRQKHVVVLKKSEAKLFLPNGQHNDTGAIRSFISEIRILSHKPVREHPNIIKILGVHWDYFETGYPEPMLLLEKANTDLAAFQSRHRSLPFETKKSIALDIARGLSALHQCGVIHGDMKPQNVLIFNKPTLHAKVADFSHSLLDTGETCNLVGGTWMYSAPEWKRSAPTAELLQTDIYSYGLVFGGLILGSELVASVEQHPPFDLSMSTEESIQKLKQDDHMKEYLFRLVHITDQDNIDSDLEEFPLINKVFESTIQLDPDTRNLERVVALFEGPRKKSHNVQRIEQSLASNAISIPYHALQGLSSILMDQVVRSLQSVAASQRDTRRAAAWVELAVCHACDISSSDGSEFLEDSKAAALSALLSAADLGDTWARAVVQRISQAMGNDIPARYATNSWLFDAASRGSRIAFESLMGLDLTQAREALRIYRMKFCGNPEQLYSSTEINLDYLRNPGLIINARRDTVLHWVVSTGDRAMFESFESSSLDVIVINSKNEQGDTPIICATRAGHFDMLSRLISLNADASLTNSFSENPLHFLTNLDNLDIPIAAQLLVGAGAELDAEATGFSGNAYLESRPRGKSCPRLRAIFANNPLALSTLIDLTANSVGASMASQAIPLSSQKHMLAWALRLHHFEILEVMEKYFRNTRLFNSLSELYVWNSGRRYSLPELCILGCVSGSPSSGFDIPEQFFRMLNHGKDYTRSLETSLLFLSSHEPRLFANPCNGARNALFYAIKEGRGEAVSFLASLQQQPGLDNLLNGPYNRLARREDISALLNWVDQGADKDKSRNEDGHSPMALLSRRTRRRQMLAAAGRRGRARSTIRMPSRDSLSSRERSEDDDDSYGDPDSDSDSNLDEDDLSSITTRQYGSGGYTPGYMSIEDDPNDMNGHGSQLPFNYSKMEGIVDAVLMSIMYGRRKIFYDLVTGVAKKTIQPPAPFPCFVMADRGSELQYNNESVERMAHAHKPTCLNRYFPVQVWNYCLTTNDSNPKLSKPFDGILRYPLLYMTVIARSIHRDIFLAQTLLSVMRKMNVPEPKEWTAGSRFESKCLAIHFAAGQITPLYHAGYLRWNELATLLMEHGASLQGQFWGPPGSSQTVLGQLYHTTKEPKSEVLDLLAIASSLNMDQTITLHDVDMLLSSYVNPRSLIQWKEGVLNWDNYYQSPPINYTRLWSAIETANTSQRQKIREDPQLSPLLNAVRRRDIVAIQHLLDFGLNVNEKIRERSFAAFFFRATALDMVSWTATVEPARCSDTGLQLKEQDAQIAELLISRGGIRGPDYVFEYLLGLTVLQCFILPIVGPVLLGFFVYLFGKLAFHLLEQSVNVRKTNLQNLATALLVFGWMFDILCALGIGLMWKYIKQRRQEGHQKLLTTKAVMWCCSVFSLAITNFIAKSTVALGDRAGLAFLWGTLSDLCAMMVCTCLGALSVALQFAVFCMIDNHPSVLAKEVQEGSPSYVVWGASRSVLRPGISKWKTRVIARFTRLCNWLCFDVRRLLMRRRHDRVVIDEWEFEAGIRPVDDVSVQSNLV